MENKTGRVIQIVRRSFEDLPDPRSGSNTRYKSADVLMGAFAIFHSQSPSFLQGQKRMREQLANDNAKTLYRMEGIPTDTHIRNVLDEIDSHELEKTYAALLAEARKQGVLERNRSYSNNLRIAVDGTQYYRSETIHCRKCSEKRNENGTTSFFHTIIAPMIMLEENRVLPLAPEFIEKQDGSEKQDCERNGFKRLLERHGQEYAAMGVTILGDDLYCNDPSCKAIKEAGLNFILTCKPSSHTDLSKSLSCYENMGMIKTVSQESFNGKHWIIEECRYINEVPIRAGDDALKVNWIEYTVIQKNNNKRTYHNTFATDFPVSLENAIPIARDGRSRWGVENGGFNILKNKGFNFEHNYGHGKNNLASMLASMILLAFFVHTLCEICDENYAELRKTQGTRRAFSELMCICLDKFFFEDWDAFYKLMLRKERIPASLFIS